MWCNACMSVNKFNSGSRQVAYKIVGTFSPAKFNHCLLLQIIPVLTVGKFNLSLLLKAYIVRLTGGQPGRVAGWRTQLASAVSAGTRQLDTASRA